MKQRPRKKPTSPIFRELAEMEEDPWWKELFFDMANGYFPARTGYLNGGLCFKTSTKIINVQIQGIDDNEELLKQVKDFFQDVVGLIPDSHFEESSLISVDSEEVFLTWNVFKKASIYRVILISNYVESLDLGEVERENLRRMIIFGLFNRTVDENNFQFGVAKIENFIPPKEIKPVCPRYNSKYEAPLKKIFIAKKTTRTNGEKETD